MGEVVAAGGGNLVKLIHIADLHIGKRIYEYSLLEDQRCILEQILDICEELKPDGILIAGDVYDKSIPTAEAVELLDEFLTSIAGRGIPCWVISGNHDSAERLAFGSRIMAARGIYMARLFDGRLNPTTLQDQYGLIDIYLLPFTKPAQVRRFYPEMEIGSYEAAVKTVIDNSGLDTTRRNVLVAHQFITSGGIEPERCESESISVGGVDNIDSVIFEGFDYVALGHLHSPQSIGRDTIRYAGSPLKYSFSEVRQSKSLTVVELKEKGQVTVQKVPFKPRRDMRHIKGPISSLLDPSVYLGTDTDDYLQVTLTDDDYIIDAIGKVRAVYPNVLQLDYDNRRSRVINNETQPADISQKTALQLFADFFQLQNNMELSIEQADIVSQILAQTGGEE